ncbi:hypothetical protein J7L05_12425 [bacterium]|nr:hypothetical protein [bacterium]
MARKEKKSYARSKKFDEVRRERKAKLQERAVQKKTGYERDLRTLMRRILAPVKAAEDGECEITKEELVKVRSQMEKLITKTRVLSGNKGVNLSRIKLKIETEKALVNDYIKGKRELAGKVDKHGEKISSSDEPDNTGNIEVTSGLHTDRVSNDYSDLGFNEETVKPGSSSEAYYRSLGFEDVSDTIDNPITKKPEESPIVVTDNKRIKSAQHDQIKKIGLTIIDSKISNVINEGIEYLMHYRRRRKKDSLGFGDEIKRFVNDEILVEKHKAMTELKNRGYSEELLQEFAAMFDREFEINKNWMVRKCLYMSRVLEYRKGATSSG